MFLPMQSEPVQRSLAPSARPTEGQSAGVESAEAGGPEVRASECGVQPSMNWDSVLSAFCQSLPKKVGGD